MLLKMTPELLAEAEKLFYCGISRRQIGKRLGVSGSTIGRYCGNYTPRSLEFVLCIRCGEIKGRDNFSKAPGEQKVCRTCRSTRHYAEELKKNYGIRLSDYQVMLESQGKSCAICRTVSPAGSNSRFKRFCIDHNHKTKKIRGLLCNRCNRALGLLGDSIKTLESAIAYLIKHDGQRTP